MGYDHRGIVEESKFVMIVATISLFLSFFNVLAIVFIFHELSK